MWAGLVLSVSCLLAAASGSKILFGATPDVIQTNLTQAMTMRCSLNDTDLLPTVGGVVGKRDVTQTADNMQTVSSIVITRNNGDHVATLIQGQPAKAVADLGTMQVHGSLTNGSHGEMGYLQLDWIYPSTAQTGEYVCEINTISPLGHNVVFSTSTEIGESVPTIGELIGFIQTLEKDRNQMQNQLDGLRHNLTTLQQQPTPAPVTGVTSSLHIEQGRVECDDSNDWHYDDHERTAIVSHKFSTPYASPPHVQIGVNSIDHGNEANTRYDVKVQSVDRTGFSVKCFTWGGPEGDSHLYHVYVDWISLA